MRRKILHSLIAGSATIFGLSGMFPMSAQAQAHPRTAAPHGQLVIADALGDPGNWDPIATFVIAWGEIGSNIFDGLVQRTPAMKIKPDLATSWKYINPRELQFNLRKGVHFQDGEPFNAAAVKFTFDRLLADKASPQYANYTAISSVQIVNPYKVIFHLNSVDPVLITKLSGYGAMIVPPKYIEAHGSAYFGNHPIGTGPFKMVSYKKDSSILLKANMHYWAGPPKLSSVLVRFVPDANTRIQMMQTSEANIIETIPPSLTSEVKAQSGYNLEATGSPTVYEIRFDTALAPLNNVLVRQAINYAVDKKAIIQKILNGYGRPISTFQGNLSFGNDPSMSNYPYDPQKAKSLLKQAHIKPGTTLTFDYDGSDATFAEVAQAAAEELQQVGLNVKLQPENTNTFYNTLIPKEKAGQMYEFGWGGWTLDFDNTAYLLYRKGQFWNPDFGNAKINSLLSTERSTNDQAIRQRAFFKIDAILHQQAVEVPLYQADTIWAVQKNVKGWVTPPDERMDLFNVSLQ